jgi:predicted neuraminidase
MKYISLILSLILSFVCAGFVKTNGQAVLVKSEYITDNPPFTSCHASTIVEVDSNKFLAAWFAGSYEGAPDVGIWISMNVNGKWNDPIEIVSAKINNTLRIACWNPVLFKGLSGKVYLFYKQGASPRVWEGFVKTSDNNGITWSEAIKLPTGFLGPIKNKPIQLKMGEILCPSSTESQDQKFWNVHLEITDESLSTWRRFAIDTLSRFGVIQPSLLVHSGGKLQMLCRSREDSIVQTWSFDHGIHWSKLSAIDVPNPNSGIDAVTISDNLHILVYNPLKKGTEWFAGRSVLKAAISNDGIHWRDVYTFENKSQGEFSYPAIIKSSDGLVHITYTVNRKKIKHVILKINKL